MIDGTLQVICGRINLLNGTSTANLRLRNAIECQLQGL